MEYHLIEILLVVLLSLVTFTMFHQSQVSFAQESLVQGSAIGRNSLTQTNENPNVATNIAAGKATLPETPKENPNVATNIAAGKATLPKTPKENPNVATNIAANENTDLNVVIIKSKAAQSKSNNEIPWSAVSEAKPVNTHHI